MLRMNDDGAFDAAGDEQAFARQLDRIVGHVIAGVEGTTALMASPINEPVATRWIAMLGFFDVVFVTLSLWMFEPLMTE